MGEARYLTGAQRDWRPARPRRPTPDGYDDGPRLTFGDLVVIRVTKEVSDRPGVGEVLSPGHARGRSARLSISEGAPSLALGSAHVAVVERPGATTLEVLVTAHGHARGGPGDAALWTCALGLGRPGACPGAARALAVSLYDVLEQSSPVWRWRWRLLGAPGLPRVNARFGEACAIVAPACDDRPLTAPPEYLRRLRPASDVDILGTPRPSWTREILELYTDGWTHPPRCPCWR